MKRTLKVTFFTAVLFASFSTIVASPETDVSAAGLSGLEMLPNCKTSIVNKLTRENLFLSVSNNLYPTGAGRIFQGCWSYSGSGPCRAIYSDNKGNYYICGECDDFGNPGGGSCNRISVSTLNSGYWCS